MFFPDITGTVMELIPNDQTHYQSIVHLTVPLAALSRVEPGTLIAARNVSAGKEKRHTILQLVSVFPVNENVKKAPKDVIRLRCTAVPLGVELTEQGAKKEPHIRIADTYTQFDADIFVLDDESTVSVIHHIAPESRVKENGSRINVGYYATNPNIPVGLDSLTLLRGNMAVISARPRARTTITNNLISSLLSNTSHPLHVVYCDVNNQGTLSLINLLSQMERASILCLNDKFVPASIFTSLKNPSDKQLHKRASLDFLDMMILPSVLESRRHDLVYPISGLLRANRITIYRPNEQTVSQFISDIRTDILDGVTEESKDYVIELLDGIVSTYGNERFVEKNTREILEMIDEFSQDSKNHSARRTLYDLRSEIQAVFESYSKDIAAQVRKSIQDVVQEMNDDTRSSLMVVQALKTSEMLRFVNTLIQTIVEERLKRLKVRVPILFIFNNMDENVIRTTASVREQTGDRFADAIQALLTSGRRHGLGFCVALESATSLDPSFARKIQSYFVGPIPFMNEPSTIAELMNVSEDLVRPAVNYEDGQFMFTSVDSPYHRRVPIPISSTKNTETMHTFLDEVTAEQERRRQEYQAQEEERKKRWEEERRAYEERRKKEEAEKLQAETEAAAKKENDSKEHGREKEPVEDESSSRRGGRRGRGDEQPAEQEYSFPAFEPMPDDAGDEALEEAHTGFVELDDDADSVLPEPVPTPEKKTSSRRRRGGKKHPRSEGQPNSEQIKPVTAAKPAESTKPVQPAKPAHPTKPVQPAKPAQPTKPAPPSQSSQPPQDTLTFATSRFGGYEMDDDPGQIEQSAPPNDSADGEPAAPPSGDAPKKNPKRRGHRRR